MLYADLPLAFLGLEFILRVRENSLKALRLCIAYSQCAVIQDVVGWESADMVNRYDDTDKDDRFEKYFGAEGIRKVEAGSLEKI